MYAFLGRYAHQSRREMEMYSTRELMEMVDEVGQIIEEESEAVQRVTDNDY